ncbi:hypothetical protein M758_5G117800 [Ceratodon purpureus]|nr:hypothetical protein M758_5G117800 [Ceratodon purpureus]KAG0616465.1 hypothetical protein M758_5G117800 [Ceratodon purpureus]
MVYPESAMARRDPSSEKENLVPRAHKSEPGSGGLGSVRTRGLMSSEQRSHAVLKESSLQNQTPSAVTLYKTNVGSTEKDWDWLKNPSSDYSSGKQSAGSLERLREKIGQLKSVGAMKSASQKSSEHHRPLDTSTLEHHFVGEIHTRSSAPHVSETPVHVYRDEKVSNSGGTQRETMKVESQRRKREMNSRIVSHAIPENARSSAEQDTVSEDYGDSDKLLPLSTPSKPSSGKVNGLMQSHLPTISSEISFKKKPSASDYLDGSRQSVQNKVDSEGNLTGELQSVSTSLVEKDMKGIMDQDSEGKCPVAGGSAQNISPREHEVKGSRESSVERPVEIIEIHSIKFERSRFGGAMRLIREDPSRHPRVTRGSDDHSPGSEKSAEDDRRSPEAQHESKTSENYVSVHTSAPTILEVGTLSASKKYQRAIQHSSGQTVEEYLSEHRKRKAEADPSITDTSPLLSGVFLDNQVSAGIAMEAHEAHEAHEDVSKGRSLTQRERERKRERGREIMVKETKAELNALEQSGDRWNEDVAGHPPTATKGTPGNEREPWAWKTARDSRSLALASPTLPEHSKSGKFVGGIPPRYVPPSLESRERKAEVNVSPASDGVEHHSGVLKQTNEPEECDPNNGAMAHSNLRVKGIGSTEDSAVNHLSDTFSAITIEENCPNGVTKISSQARTLTQVTGHHMNVVPTENVSHTGVTGVTSLTGLTPQSVGIPHKTAVTSSHGVEQQHRPQCLQPSRERDRVTELSDRNGLPKSAARSVPTAPEVPVHDVHEGHSAKSSDPPKDRGDKNQEIPPNNSQVTRKTRTETENDKFVYVNGIRYQKLGKIGKGGSSEVFKVIATDCSIYALKRINLKGRDWSTAQEFYQEIKYLKALRGKRHIIQLVDSEVTNKKVLEKKTESGDITEEAFIYMVLEFGEIDLAGMLSAKRKEMHINNETKLDENWLRFYWQQILKAVKTIHDERIVHSDLKPANFMLVRGELKLIDFGIAKAIQNDTTNIVKENQTGTLNYMAPEAFLQNQTDEAGLEIKIGRASDIWSLGCIFYQMVYGQTPFAELSFYSKITAITNPHHKINYPRLSNPWLLDIMKRCLTWDRRKRLRIPELLEHPFIQPQELLEQIYQTLARTPSSERSHVVDLILSSYGSWGPKHVSGNSRHSGHESPT